MKEEYKYHCVKCRYKWNPKNAASPKPKACPNCKSYKWEELKPTNKKRG